MLQQFINTVDINHLNVFGIVILQSGKKVAEHHFQPDCRRDIYSITKSITSAAIGIALEDGTISLEDNVADLLSDEISAGINVQDMEALHKVTLERLLTMSIADYPFRPDTVDWLKYVLELPLPNIDKRVFHYSNVCAYLAGVMLEKASKKHLIDFLKERLFRRLHWDNPEYKNCSRGHFYGASGMKLTLKELSDFGQMYLQNGVFCDKHILSEDWVRSSTRKQIDCREGGYGYFFWRLDSNSYQASGKNGQRCIICPEKNAVIAIMSELTGKTDSNLLEQAIQKTIMINL